ncbi:MAG: hypothetical protein ACO2ZM_09875 [Francisellaceae bacterium]
MPTRLTFQLSILLSTDAILPPSDTTTLVDKIQLVTLIFMVFTLMIMLLNYYLHAHHKKMAQKINLLSILFTLLVVFSINIYLIWF